MIAASLCWRHTETGGDQTEWRRTITIAAVPTAGDYVHIPGTDDYRQRITRVTYWDEGHVEIRLDPLDDFTADEDWAASLRDAQWRRAGTWTRDQPGRT